MTLADFAHAVCLTCPGREAGADRVVALLAARGVACETLRNGPTDWPDPPDGWRSGKNQWSQFRTIKAAVGRARREGLNSLLVVEDDLDLSPDFDLVVARAEVPDDWAFLYYGANHTYHPTEEAGLHVLRLHGSFCTHCLGIRSAAFDPILALPEIGPMDWAIGACLHHQLPAYALWPSVATQRPGRSTMTGKDCDYSDVFKNKGTNWATRS